MLSNLVNRVLMGLVELLSLCLAALDGIQVSAVVAICCSLRYVVESLLELYWERVA